MVTFNTDIAYNSKTLKERLTEMTSGKYDPEEHVAVTTIFPTIQGEAPFAGHTAIFLRLAGCNRGSKIDKGCYFCDTFFALNKDTKLYSVEALAAELAEMAKDIAQPLLVITGGEPMLQAEALASLLPAIATTSAFSLIQFETNGDLFLTNEVKELLDVISEINEGEAELLEDQGEEAEHDFINIVISPKRTVKEPPSGAFIGLAEEPNVYLRLVVSGDPDSVYYTIPQFLIDGWPIDAFWISPLTEYKKAPADNEIADILEDIDLAATRRNVDRAIHLAKMFGMRVSLQAHSYIGIK